MFCIEPQNIDLASITRACVF